MVRVTRFNGKEYYINCDLIESIEETPDTVITMTTGRKIIVNETIEEVIKGIVAFKRRISIEGI